MMRDMLYTLRHDHRRARHGDDRCYQHNMSTRTVEIDTKLAHPPHPIPEFATLDTLDHPDNGAPRSIRLLSVLFVFPDR
jgi:hypothetical protein